MLFTEQFGGADGVSVNSASDTRWQAAAGSGRTVPIEDADGPPAPCRLEQLVVERYTRLEEQMAASYEGIALNPTPGEFQQLLRAVPPP